jgi:hypothetical protein
MNKTPGSAWHPCDQCGKEFWRTARKHGKPLRKFCSRACVRLKRHAESDGRFWEKVNKDGPGGCWLWTGYTQRFGHGTMGRGDGKGGVKTILAHRYSWEIANGPIPAGMCLLHKCDVPACVNPEHLFIGDRIINAKDKMAKGRYRCRYEPIEKLIHPHLSRRLKRGAI